MIGRSAPDYTTPAARCFSTLAAGHAEQAGQDLLGVLPEERGRRAVGATTRVPWVRSLVTHRRARKAPACTAGRSQRIIATSA